QTAIPQRLARGEDIDVLTMVGYALDKLVQQGKVEDRANIARSLMGAVVKQGAPAPDISTVDKLRQALLNANSIAVSDTAHGFCHYCLLILPTAVLAMALPGGPFGAEYGPILALATGMFVLYGALSLPQGWLAARFGRKHLMTVFFLGTGASLVLCGFAF